MKLPSNQELEARYQERKKKYRWCWHRYKLASCMYGDAAVDCVKCGTTHYTDVFELFCLRALGKMVK